MNTQSNRTEGNNKSNKILKQNRVMRSNSVPNCANYQWR